MATAMFSSWRCPGGSAIAGLSLARFPPVEDCLRSNAPPGGSAVWLLTTELRSLLLLFPTMFGVVGMCDIFCVCATLT